MRNPIEADWMREFAVRKALGGYYPKDPFKADFFTGLISIQNQTTQKHNNLAHLQYLIQKNR